MWPLTEVLASVFALASLLLCPVIFVTLSLFGSDRVFVSLLLFACALRLSVCVPVIVSVSVFVCVSGLLLVLKKEYQACAVKQRKRQTQATDCSFAQRKEQTVRQKTQRQKQQERQREAMTERAL